MAIDHETWLRDMQRENWKFAVQLVIGSVVALAIGVAIGVWITDAPRLSAAPPGQTAPAQSLAPG